MVGCVRGMDEIVPRLWVGGLPTRTVTEGVMVDAIASCIKPYDDFPQSGLIWWAEPFPDDELQPRYRGMALDLTRRVVEWHREGLVVLVNCSYGANRSALVAGLAMVQLGVCTGEEAIGIIRSKRRLPRDHGPALDNPSFREFLRAYAPQTG